MGRQFRPILRSDLTKTQFAHHAQSLAAALDPLEATLAGRPYLAGQDFTVADILLGINVYRWFILNVERPRVPKITAWYHRLRQRPAFRAHVIPPETPKVGLKLD